jgi:hypothetical protein
MKKSECQFLAMVMAVVCVRNTVIETYHTDGKITDPEMMTFNKEVVNRLYSFLTLYFAETDEVKKIAFVNVVERYFPHGWDFPKLDRSFVTATNRMLKKMSKATVAE